MKIANPKKLCPCGSGRKYNKCCGKNPGRRYRQAANANTAYLRAVEEGKRLRQAGQLHQSIEVFRQAATVQPMVPEARFNLGFVLAEAGHHAAAAGCFQQALILRPDYGEALNEIGRLCLNSSRLEDAAGYFERAVRLLPDQSQVHFNLGAAISHTDVGRAVECFRHALALKPDYLNARSALLVAINYLSEYDAAAIYREHQVFAVEHEKHATTGKVSSGHTINSREKMRIGYVSADLRAHPVGSFMEPVLSHHDRERFEVFVFHNHPVEDAVSKRLQAHVDHWHNIAGMTDDQARALIMGKSIDILTDLSGHTFRNRLMLFAKRSAPVQATWLGGPATTGLTSMDYFITDEIADPLDQKDYFSEALAYLPGGFSCFKPSDDAPDVAALPQKKRGFVTFGSLNSLNKINRNVMDLWAALLRKTPDARLLIFRNSLNGKVRSELRQAFVSRGVHPDSLDMRGEEIEKQSYLNIYNEIDVLLDTFPWSGHTTACESLWMGVPVVTLRSDRHAGRTVASVLHQVGLSQLVADSAREYLATSSHLAGDPDTLDSLRRSLRATMQASTLCNSASFTRNLESLFQDMHTKRLSVDSA